MAAPTLRRERQLLRAGATRIACIDEVGRGALAGPVTVGVVIVTRACGKPPGGVRDSKALTGAMRERLRPQIEAWAPGFAIGHASPQEIDREGIVVAMRIAAVRALAAVEIEPDAVLLDGSHDYLSDSRQRTLFEEASYRRMPPVTTVVRGDQSCAGIACASILAKCARDDLMRDLAADFRAYEWDRNKGYGSVTHLGAIAAHGLTPHHRASWRIATTL
ncbi:MAG: ribonuclease HII [Actinomycetota bacterium]